MKIQPKTMQEAMNLVYDVLIQGDSRYIDFENEKILTQFILNQAIFLEEKDISDIEKPEEEIHFSEVQRGYKLVAKLLLEQQGFKDNEIFFERRFLGLAPDVFAEREDLIIPIECCSCKISKIIDYLSKAEEVWVFTLGENPWEEKLLFKKMQWFIFKKGPNWNKIYDALQKKKTEGLKKIKSPIDSF